MTQALRKNEEMLSGFVRSRAAGHPVPLQKVAYKVEIVSGLAIVTQTRWFRNVEAQPIEASLTFPVSYDAVVNSVKAIVDGRSLVGVTKAKEKARATYEEAIDDGKAAVLHEELMRGLHMVSAGNIKSGGEIVIEARYVSPLSIVGSAGRLRIPLTIGAIYGATPLIESDDIAIGGAVVETTVEVGGADGVTVNGKQAQGEMAVSSGGVISIEVADVALPAIQGKASGGSYARIEFSVPAKRLVDLHADLLLDASGSMGAGYRGDGVHKWAAMLAGVKAAATSDITGNDIFRLWTFSTGCEFHGERRGGEIAGAVSDLPFSNGGTEIGVALSQVISKRGEANILLVTDGQSHGSIDIDALKASGARVTVVLIGAAAFEAYVGHAAALTGGQMFVVAEDGDIKGVVRQALASMRGVASSIRTISKLGDDVVRTIGGLSFDVHWSDSALDGVKEHDAAAAYATYLSVAALPAEAAAKAAEGQSLVTHLTSTVLVDHDGETVDGVPVTRKVALTEEFSLGLTGGGGAMLSLGFAASPAVRSMSLVGSSAGSGEARVLHASTTVRAHAFYSDPAPAKKGLIARAGNVLRGGRGVVMAPVAGLPPSLRRKTTIETVITEEYHDILSPHAPVIGVPRVFAAIDWDASLSVINGTPCELSVVDLEIVKRLSIVGHVVSLAAKLGKQPAAVAVALLATKFGKGSRTAGRIARTVLAGADKAEIDAALALI
jgi:hypothetical protein